ncbi:hypothetical protein BH11MYX4_BH11MYX4_39680 [soil metagenome]
MNRIPTFSLLLLASLSSAALSLVACDTETASSSVIDNGYPAPPADGSDPAKQTVVYRAWWFATYYPAPIPGGASSDVQRAVPASDVAYAVLAPGWDPASTTPPPRLVVVRSKAPLAVARCDLLRIVFSDTTFTGDCAAGQPLSQDEADFVTQRIFPGVFTDMTYDAKTCTTREVTDAAAPDTGRDAHDG